MAGKTSLVRSMQWNKRELTRRSSDSKLDEATKVFKVCEADIDDKSKLVFHDFGGQAIYHFAYQLSFRSQFVPMLVVDIAEFDRLVTVCGLEAACEEVCFDWLSHLYLSCPKVMPPIVVLTHKDGIKAKDILQLRQKQLIEVTEQLRRKIIDEEEVMAPENSPFFSMKSFADTSTPLIKKKSTVVFSKASKQRSVSDLKSLLFKAGSPLLTEIPNSWHTYMLICSSQKEKPYLTLDELDALFSDDKDRYILQYLHEIGKVMWYRNRGKLAGIVFHRIELLTKVVELLFDHSGKEAWDQRINEFHPFKMDSLCVNKMKYIEMVGCFRNKGLINSILLSHLIQGECDLEPHLAIEVLKVFHLVCGPVLDARESFYIVPFFSKEIITVIETGDYIPMKLEIVFNGLAIPGYVYHLLTAIFVDFLLTQYNRIESGQNGACVKESDGSIQYLIHDQPERTVNLLLLTKAHNMAVSWKSQLSTLQHLTSELRSVWSGAHFETVFYCSHCLLKTRSTVTTQINPTWIDTPHPEYTGTEVCVCDADDTTKGIPTVPHPLMFPCE